MARNSYAGDNAGFAFCPNPNFSLKVGSLRLLHNKAVVGYEQIKPFVIQLTEID